MGSRPGRRGRRYDRLVANAKAREKYCWRCGMALDYSIPYLDPHTGAENPDSPSYEHALPLSTHPHLAEDPGNGRISHLLCNKQAGNLTDEELSTNLGTTSQDWT